MSNLAVSVKNDRSAALNTDIGPNAVLKVYNAAPPATVETAQSGTVLATFTCNATAFGASASGVLTANPIASVVIATTGNAAGARLFKADGATGIADFSVTATGGGGDITFPTISFQQNVTASISSLTITEQ